jgi:hypothetical protein
MRKNPEKSGFPPIFCFTPGLPIPYHLVANGAFRRVLRGAGRRIVQREKSEKGELWQLQK